MSSQDRDSAVQQRPSSPMKTMCVAGAICVENTIHDAAGYFHQGTCRDGDWKEHLSDYTQRCCSTPSDVFRQGKFCCFGDERSEIPETTKKIEISSVSSEIGGKQEISCFPLSFLDVSL